MDSTYVDIIRRSEIGAHSLNTIFEIGSCDCRDALELARLFPAASIYSFEANPEAAAVCRENLARNPGKRINLVEMAASDSDGNIDFRPFDLSKYNNIAASSMFEIDFSTNRSRNDPDYGRRDVQKLITVRSCRIDSYCLTQGIDAIDLLCIDVQGAELLVLRGLGSLLETIRMIILECSFVSTYRGGCSFQDVNEYLSAAGFQYAFSNAFGKHFPRKRKGFFEFDCLFSKKASKPR